MQGYFCFLLAVVYAFEVKFVVAIHMVSYIELFDWKKLWLESDSTYMITLFQTNSFLMSWRWYPTCVDCLERITCMKFCYSHIFKDDNSIFNIIAFRTRNIYTTI